MSKVDRQLRKIKRLEIKMANLEYKLDNERLTYNYLKAMEDDSADWECEEEE